MVNAGVGAILNWKLDGKWIADGGVADSFPDAIPPKFHMNRSVLRMLMVCGVALILPITLAVIGFSGLRKGASGEAGASAQGDAGGEIAGLRETLETIANEKLPAPGIDGGTRRFVFEKSATYEKTADAIRQLLSSPEATAIPTDESRSRWIVKVPAASAKKFDETLTALKPVQLPSYPILDKSEEVIFYEINLTRVP